MIFDLVTLNFEKQEEIVLKFDRIDHTACLINGTGLVLVAGGNIMDDSDQVEIIDSDQHKSDSIQSMKSKGSGSVSICLQRRVYVLAGKRSNLMEMLEKPYYGVEWVVIQLKGYDIMRDIKHAGVERYSETEIILFGGMQNFKKSSGIIVVDVEKQCHKSLNLYSKHEEKVFMPPFYLFSAEPKQFIYYSIYEDKIAEFNTSDVKSEINLNL